MKFKHLLPILLLSLIVLLFFSSRQKNQTPPPSPVNSVSQAPITLIYPCTPGQTAFTLLQQNAQIEFETSSYGKLVTSINGQAQGNGKYWLYTVDGQEATVGADSYNCTDSEEIIWQLR